MIKFFRKIRKKLLEQGKTANYLKYAIGEIVLLVINKTMSCPVRYNLWATLIDAKSNHRAFRYEIYNVPKGTFNQHKTYLLPR